ncbi:MAG: restriction endonuclease subunit S [Anaerolineae bacterium]
MKPDWKISRAFELETTGDLFVQDGNHGEYRPRSNEFVKDGIPFVRAGDMKNGRIDFASAERINDAAFKRIRKGIAHPGDIILSSKGTVGSIAIAGNEYETFVCSPQTTFWRVNKCGKLNRRYLYYFMQSGEFVHQMDALKGQTDMAAYLSLTDQRKMWVRVPPLFVQQRIADILGALDDKIECNRHVNKTLEVMSETCFNYWLATSEKDGEGKPLDEIADFLNGLALQKFPPKNGSSLPVIKIAELHRGITESTDRASEDIPSQYIVNDGDVLFSWSGSLDVCIWCDGRGALNQHLFKVTSSKYPKWFYYQWIKHHLPHFREIAAGKATTMGHIQREHLHQALAAVPSSEMLQLMNAKMQPILDQIISNNLESRLLRQTRDYLLPKLLSGEIKVKAAEEQIAGVNDDHPLSQ